jgi:predicted RNA-binding Zn-ribbon protein involved in translation (DUF1610 family)
MGRREAVRPHPQERTGVLSYDDEDSDWDIEIPDDSEEHGTVECPHCGADIYEDAPQCPVCGEYVIRGSGEFWKHKPGWYVLLALLGIIAVIVALTAVP